MEECEILAIKKQDLVKILKNYSSISTELNTIANQRYEKNKEAIKLSKRVGVKLNEDRSITNIYLYISIL